jgi:signal transduction histidine kinase
VSRLHSRIYLHFLGVLLAVGVLVSIAFALGTGGGPWREVAERAARHVASLVGEAWGQPDLLARRLSQLQGDLELDMTLRELDGRIAAKVGPALPALTADEAADVRAGRVVVARRPRWFAAAPVRDGAGRVVGILQAAGPRRLGPPSLLVPLLAVAGVLAIAAVATRPLARRIARPLERLTEGARRLGGGDLGYRVPGESPRRPWWGRGVRAADELAALTRAFNEMAERVERTVRGQKELLVNVSHELRSPLARVRMALALLPTASGGDARLRDVERDLGELDHLIDDVLTAARLEASDLPAHLGEVSVRRLLEEIAGRARSHPLTAGMAVEVAAGADVTLMADEALVRRALWNLVENAAKYGAPPIVLAAARDGELVRLSVSDGGPGIPPGDRERVLDPFVRLDTARTPAEGSVSRGGVGLGLTLVRRVAEVHGGTVTISPASVADGRERGCRVTLAIPVGA